MTYSYATDFHYIHGSLDAEELVLTKYIDMLNKGYQKEMDNNPNLWIGKLNNDPKHWAEYGVYTIGDLENYLDKEAS